MKHSQKAVLYLDDGHPESREYADNYVWLQPAPRIGLWRGLLGLLPRRYFFL